MNVDITGIYDNPVIVDSNLCDASDGVRLLHTGLSSLSGTLLGVVEGLPNKNATLSDDYEAYAIMSICDY